MKSPEMSPNPYESGANTPIPTPIEHGDLSSDLSTSRKPRRRNLAGATGLAAATTLVGAGIANAQEGEKTAVLLPSDFQFEPFNADVNKDGKVTLGEFVVTFPDRVQHFANQVQGVIAQNPDASLSPSTINPPIEQLFPDCNPVYGLDQALEVNPINLDDYETEIQEYEAGERTLKKLPYGVAKSIDPEATEQLLIEELDVEELCQSPTQGTSAEIENFEIKTYEDLIDSRRFEISFEDFKNSFIDIIKDDGEAMSIFERSTALKKVNDKNINKAFEKCKKGPDAIRIAECSYLLNASIFIHKALKTPKSWVNVQNTYDYIYSELKSQRKGLNIRAQIYFGIS